LDVEPLLHWRKNAHSTKGTVLNLIYSFPKFHSGLEQANKNREFWKSISDVINQSNLFEILKRCSHKNVELEILLTSFLILVILEKILKNTCPLAPLVE